MILIPFFLIFLLLPAFAPWGRYAALAVFLAASFTDCLDGWIARKYDMITDFGKLMDPMADKILVISAMVALVGISEMNSIACIIILARELLISGLRLVAAGKGSVVAADKWGKIKTVFQMLYIILVLAYNQGIFAIINQVVLWIAVILTVISVMDYLIKNKNIL